ncbi:double-stranded RNA-binding protein 1-like [Rhodamnia argentea]|uniref:Double-stranded RNA-binding protein 1-like n=1 Tax=Rhodamnia argentea TaxID=178133 RepID=A0A8B8MWG6_9MYRT|nr:double-stranded RNA-binding protein 1-like [Rhodamnia argentea]
MYKSKLQELCCRRSWSLPEYNAVKEGPNHLPCFIGTVFVNGHFFRTPDPYTTSKGARNEATGLAFGYLSALPPPACSASFNAIPPGVAPPPPSGEGMQSVFTNQLQKFAQQRSLALPTYDFEHEGSPHAPFHRFKCKVSIDGRTYETVESYNTYKEAQHAAAGIALMWLSYDTFQEVECAVYKNLFVDCTKKQGYCLSIYGTFMRDKSHKQAFVSTVEIEGETFIGQEATTKKMAECSAAKVAYTTLKERTLSKLLISFSPGKRQVDWH